MAFRKQYHRSRSSAFHYRLHRFAVFCWPVYCTVSLKCSLILDHCRLIQIPQNAAINYHVTDQTLSLRFNYKVQNVLPKLVDGTFGRHAVPVSERCLLDTACPLLRDVGSVPGFQLRPSTCAHIACCMYFTMDSSDAATCQHRILSSFYEHGHLGPGLLNKA